MVTIRWYWYWLEDIVPGSWQVVLVSLRTSQQPSCSQNWEQLLVLDTGHWRVTTLTLMRIIYNILNIYLKLGCLFGFGWQWSWKKANHGWRSLQIVDCCEFYCILMSKLLTLLKTTRHWIHGLGQPAWQRRGRNRSSITATISSDSFTCPLHHATAHSETCST